MVTLITKCGNMVLGPAAASESHSCRYEVEEFGTLAYNLQFTHQKLNYLSDEMASQLGNYGKERKLSPIFNCTGTFSKDDFSQGAVNKVFLGLFGLFPQ